MAQADEPITASVVRDEVFAALEAMAEDGDSELGVFSLKEEGLRTILLQVGKKTYSLRVARVKSK